MSSQAWDKRNILAQALEIARRGCLALHILAQAQGLSFMRYEYSRHQKGDVCYQPHLPMNILSVTLSRHSVNTLRLSYCWNNSWLSLLMLPLKPGGFFVQWKADYCLLKKDIFSCQSYCSCKYLSPPLEKDKKVMDIHPEWSPEALHLGNCITFCRQNPCKHQSELY